MRKAIIIPMLIFPLVLCQPAASSATAREEQSHHQSQTLTTPLVEPQLDSSRSEPGQISNRELFLQAAIDQIGTLQDCTDLIQNALASIGLAERRDAGGFDFGVHSADRVGYQIDPADAMPGDIASTGAMDGGHVWVVLDPATSTGVHGGYEKEVVGGDGRTVIAVDPLHLSAHTVIRLY